MTFTYYQVVTFDKLCPKIKISLTMHHGKVYIIILYNSKAFLEAVDFAIQNIIIFERLSKIFVFALFTANTNVLYSRLQMQNISPGINMYCFF